MKLARIALVLIFIAALIHFVRQGDNFPLPQAFPFLGGRRPFIFEAGGCAMLLITYWGIRRLNRAANRRSEAPSNEEPVYFGKDSYPYDHQ